MSIAGLQTASRAQAILCLWLPGAVVGCCLVYATFVLKPIADDNERLRRNVARLAVISDQVVQLARTLAVLRRELDGETSSYLEMLRQLDGWHLEAHTHFNRIAASAGMEVREMEWSKPELMTPVFATDRNQRWLRTDIFIRLRGTWEAHLDFARRLADSECLVQVVESRVFTTEYPGQLEVAVSLLVYHPGEGVRV